MNCLKINGILISNSLAILLFIQGYWRGIFKYDLHGHILGELPLRVTKNGIYVFKIFVIRHFLCFVDYIRVSQAF